MREKLEEERVGGEGREDGWKDVVLQGNRMHGGGLCEEI